MAVMHWMLIGYMFLFIHRPFEVWPWLGELHLERIYVLLMLAAWSIWPGKRLIWNWQHLAYAAMAAAVLAAWLLSPWSDHGQPVVEDWFKILVFYVLLVTCVSDERGLKRIVSGFMLVMSLYMLHSLREYVSGRHTYRMGIPRMIGVDSSLGDPNSFAASIVFALPFVLALWKGGIGGRFGKACLIGFSLLAMTCILLTGSRSGLLGLAGWVTMLTFSIRRGWLALLAAVLCAPAVYLALPPSLQTRFETIVNPEAGTEIERQSGQGRIEGFLTGLELWSANPIAGVGPGAWRPATGSSIESHNVIGQLAGETGTLGVLAFGTVLLAFALNWRAVRRAHAATQPIEWPLLTANAVGQAVLLLLLMGLFGHNLFRFSWVWYGAFIVIARFVSMQIESTAAAESMEIEQENDTFAQT